MKIHSFMLEGISARPVPVAARIDKSERPGAVRVEGLGAPDQGADSYHDRDCAGLVKAVLKSLDDVDGVQGRPAVRITFTSAEDGPAPRGGGHGLAAALAALDALDRLGGTAADRGILAVGGVRERAELQAWWGARPALALAARHGWTAVGYVTAVDSVGFNPKTRVTAEGLYALAERLRKGATDIDGAGAYTRPERLRREPAKGSLLDEVRQPLSGVLAHAARARTHTLIIAPTGCGMDRAAIRTTSEHDDPDPATTEEIRLIYSAAGIEHIPRVPFRAPHWHTQPTAVRGTPRGPGEVSLAHGGILYLSALNAFTLDTLAAVADAARTGQVAHHAAHGQITVPSRFTLIACTTACPCGNPSTRGPGWTQECRCTDDDRQRWMSRYLTAMEGVFARRAVLDLGETSGEIKAATVEDTTTSTV